MRDALLLLMAVSLAPSCSNGDPAGPGTDTGLQPGIEELAARYGG